MASLFRRADSIHIRFRFQGFEFKRTLKTQNQSDADCARAIVEQTIYRIRTGQLPIRPDVDLGDFIVSGGTLLPRAPAAAEQLAVPSFTELKDDYLAHIEHVAAPSYSGSQRTHLKHFSEFLKSRAKEPITSIADQDIQRFINRQLANLDPNTVNKQRITLVQFYKYVVKKRKLLLLSPMLNIDKISFGYDRFPFRTKAEIEGILTRGGLDEAGKLDLWECLYLNPTEIAGLLDLVRRRAEFETSLMLHAIPAYTGIRRGEILRLKWVDVDLEAGVLTAHSRKQSRSRREVTRRIDIHPELKELLENWRAAHPLGQYVLCTEGTTEPLSSDKANNRFWQPMRRTEWCLDVKKSWFKIGFHSYRHSFASNLASLGVDQRIIDEFMGHTTEEMRKRYRHLFPSRKAEAIRAISYAISPES
ncbi:tyrosine-type recombinase/integrase [Anatilimnocola floriformis]|uniref:tyrosine-type recombinase/integrase n=1 Tax=Anatilimnocola floriformis TaxID=2948575 RepID=UPI0020C2D836|nr:tyrosine-type recombinase/integrase [Anatilimnocola floriformis]